MKNVVRFWRGGWRKAECSVCGCLCAKKIGAMRHARYHVARGEGREKQPGAYLTYRDATVYDDHTDITGWVTSEIRSPG